ncbi:ECF RNA polymerase sigma factor SigW [bacterium BMS3Abin14]|nr:ECF RNA polymerase sigma factor SigW [bacterium BMS3Abin14]
MLSAPDINDSDLAVRIQKGDRDAFTELVSAYQNRIFNFTYQFFRNEDLAAELTQETFLRVFRFIKRYDPRKKFSTWIYSIAKNICIDEYRRMKRGKTVSMDEVPPGAIVRDDGALHLKDPSHISIQMEERMFMEESIALLPEKYRTAIILCYFQDLSYREIADVLGISLNLVKVRIFRAKKRLLEIIRDRSCPDN